MRILLVIIFSVSMIFLVGRTIVNADCGLCVAKDVEAKESTKLDKDTFQKSVYQCAKCRYESKKKGKCPNCKEDLKKVKITKTYSCDSCEYTQKKSGDCPKCKAPLKKKIVTYECEACKTSSNTPADCDHCKTPLKRKVK